MRANIRRRWAPLAVAATVAVTGAAGALALSSRADAGPQPWDALPRSTAAFVAVDLDPSLHQKLQALRLAHALGGQETGDLRTAVTDALLGGTGWGVPASSAREWAGDRSAAGVAVGVAGSLVPTPLAALEVDDAPRRLRHRHHLPGRRRRPGRRGVPVAAVRRPRYCRRPRPPPPEPDRDRVGRHVRARRRRPPTRARPPSASSPTSPASAPAAATAASPRPPTSTAGPSRSTRPRPAGPSAAPPPPRPGRR